MSLILPSFELIPGKFNVGSLFAQIPMDGSADLTVTRGSDATRFNASGNVQVMGSGIPRLDYYTSGGVTGCPALLVEPAGTNLCLQSEDFNTTWNQQNSLTVNSNTTISPDGTQNADTINVAAVSDSRITQVITVANSTTYTISCFYKNIALTSGQTFNMRFNNFLTAPNNLLATAAIDLAEGTATYTIGGTAGTGFSGTATGRVENYGNGWYRVSMTFTVGTAGGNGGGFQIAQVGSATARSFYAWGAQLETGSVATSYIPTTAGTGSRSADVISVTGAVSGSIGQTEGVLYCEFEFPNADKGDVIRVESADGNNVVEFISQNTTTQRARIRASGGSFAVYNANPANMAINTRFKLAIAYKSGDTAIYINGISQATDTATFTFNSALTRITLGQDIAVGRRAIRIFAAALYTTRLTNAQLEFLTSPYTSYSQMATTLSYTIL